MLHSSRELATGQPISLSLEELIRLRRRREILGLHQETELFLNHVLSFLVRLVHLNGDVCFEKLVIELRLGHCSSTE